MWLTALNGRRRLLISSVGRSSITSGANFSTLVSSWKKLREEVEIQRQSGPQNLLELLPDEFSREQYYLMRQSQGKAGNGDSTLRTWMSRNYLYFDTATGNYCKTEEYKNKYGGKR